MKGNMNLLQNILTKDRTCSSTGYGEGKMKSEIMAQ